MKRNNLLKELFDQDMNNIWNDISNNIQLLIGNQNWYPSNYYKIFRSSRINDEEILLCINPIVFILPMKAGTSREIYVIVSGKIKFEKVSDNTETKLRSIWYETKVEIYQNYEIDPLKHIFGARYESDKNFDHPIHHAHITKNNKLIQLINENLENVERAKLEEKKKPKQKQKGIQPSPYHSISDKIRKYSQVIEIDSFLENVKIPTAQMDFFSVIIQICADHLLSKKNRSSKKSNFKKLIDSCNFFLGNENGFNNQSDTLSDTVCMRSGNWYVF